MFSAVNGTIHPSDEGFRLLTLARLVKGYIIIVLFNGNVREGETVHINRGYLIFTNDLVENHAYLTMRVQEIYSAMTRKLNLTDYGDCLRYSLATSVYLLLLKS